MHIHERVLSSNTICCCSKLSRSIDDSLVTIVPKLVFCDLSIYPDIDRSIDRYNRSNDSDDRYPVLFSRWLCRYGCLPSHHHHHQDHAHRPENDHLASCAADFVLKVQRWKEEGVFEVEHEFENSTLTSSSRDLTTSIHHEKSASRPYHEELHMEHHYRVLVVDWIEHGQGILHDFHQYMLFHLYHSWHLVPKGIYIYIKFHDHLPACCFLCFAAFNLFIII
jgi:hypothetical protein